MLGPGVVTVYIKSDDKRNINLGQCQRNEKCEDSCGKPALISGTEILGNMVSVGAKIRYRCMDGSNSGISECLPNGTVRLTNLTCNCTSSHLEDNWTYRETENIGYDTDYVFCSGENAAICNFETGDWYNISNYCNPCGKALYFSLC